MLRPAFATLALVTFFAWPALAQDSRRALPGAVPAQVESPPPEPVFDPVPFAELLAAQGDEPVLIERLNGLIFLSDEAQIVARPAVAGDRGLDTRRVSILAGDAFETLMSFFLGQPMSAGSLGRLRAAVRLHLQTEGHPFTVLYVPEQDVTAGVVQVVVRDALLDGEIGVENERWFSARSYLAGMRLRSGDPIDLERLQQDVAWVNRHPFRRVIPVVEPGATSGSTRITLRAAERRPLRAFGGYDNSGTPLSGQTRWVAGLTWGNAFGLGHLVTYQVRADPRFSRSRSHAVDYSLGLPWRHTLTAYAATAALAPDLVAPFDQAGRMWQVGARYGMPLRPTGVVSDHQVHVGVDFKSSDNTLEFADIPITDNETHVAQASVGYSAQVVDRWGMTAVQATLFHSPGGLTTRNDTRFFDISRAGATADYTYTRINLSRRTRIATGSFWDVAALVQVSNRNLLGSEQVAAGGVDSVRGYDEGSVFGDHGIVVRQELSLPTAVLPEFLGADVRRPRVYVFHDSARVSSALRLPDEARSVTLQSVGVGVDWAPSPALDVQVSYGIGLTDLAGRPAKHGRVHASLQASY